jgi:hypothetical protein
MAKRLDLYNVVRIKKTHMQRRMLALARTLERDWKSLAAAGLNTTSVTYRNNIVVENTDEAKLVLVLRGTLPNMIEQGLGPSGVGSFGPFDMRAWILGGKSSNLRFWRGQPYVNIPFRMGGKQVATLGYSLQGVNALAAIKKLAPVGSVQGSSGTYKTFDPATGKAGWPKGVHSLGDPLSGAKRQAMDATRGGPPGRLGAGFAPRMRSKPVFLSDPLTSGVSVQEPHATDPLAGMVKFSKQYSTVGSGGMYGTFRRMTSWGKAWMHPGIKPRRYAEKLDVGGAIQTAFVDLV